MKIKRKIGKVINNFFQKSHKISFFQSRDKEGGLIFRVLQVELPSRKSSRKVIPARVSSAVGIGVI